MRRGRSSFRKIGRSRTRSSGAWRGAPGSRPSSSSSSSASSCCSEGSPPCRAEGWKYFTTSGYSTLRKPYHYGAAAQMYGTVIVSLIAVILGVPVAIGTALFLTEYAPLRTRRCPHRPRRPGCRRPQHHLRALGAEGVPAPDHRNEHLDRESPGVHPDLQGATRPPFNGSFFVAGLIVGHDDRADRGVGLPRSVQPRPTRRA